MIMATDVLEIIKNIQDLYENNSSLAVLKDFERVLDELDLYVYDNWEDGELAYGPKVSRHWIKAGFMWPLDKMPDPTGGKRLIDLGCKVTYQKSHILEPRPIKNPDDIRPGTKKGKLDRHPIWIVEIQMPKKIAFDMYKGYMDKLKNENIAPPEAPAQGNPPPAAGMPPPMAGGMPPPAAGGMPGGAPGGMPGGMPGAGAPAPM
jgi:hypothetical protein